MSWDARQMAMLKEMGIGAFWPVNQDAPGRLPDTPQEGDKASAHALPHAHESSPESTPDLAPERATTAPALASTLPAGTLPLIAPAPQPSTPASRRQASPSGVSNQSAQAAAAPAPEPLSLQARQAVAAMDWPALQAAVQACKACGLCERRTQTVFGSGDLRARWMIVGEAPGEQEDRQGEPFVGRAGQLLDRMLDAVGVRRQPQAPSQGAYIANVLKCRPPGNRNPTPEEVLRCEPYLLRQLELVQPEVIVAMGRFAAQALLKTNEPIGRLRERVHDWCGRPVVVTYHPAYLLRNPADKALAWADLCLARDLVARAPSP